MLCLKSYFLFYYCVLISNWVFHVILYTSKLEFNVVSFSFKSYLFSTLSARQCKTYPNRFCYICGELTFAKEKRSTTSHIKKMYKAYFDCHLGDQDRSWAPHVCCLTCEKTLSAWYAGKIVHMKFGATMIWREQKDHSNDCYFCQHDFTGCTTAKKK